MLKKKEDNEDKPDYEDIEIKVKRYFSKGYITLFNANPNLNENSINYIYENYAYYNPKKMYYKTFETSFNTLEYKKIRNKNFILKVNKKDKIIYLEVYNNKKEQIDNKIGWTYEYIQEKLDKKIKKLAIIKTMTKKINNIEYYNYNKIQYYKLKSFDNFINALEEGKIRITFKIGVYTNGNKLGEIHNHGTGFDIKEEDIEKIYSIY